MPGVKGNKNALKHGLRMDLSKLDGRTAPARAVKQILKELREYVGEGTVATELLLHRIAYKCVKLSMYEATKIDDMTAEESPAYIPLANSLRLDIQQLEKMVGSGSKAPDLQSYLSQNYGEASKKGKNS